MKKPLISNIRLALICTALLIFIGAGLIHHKSLQVTQWQETQGILEYAYTQNRSVASRDAWGKNVAIIRYHYSVGGKRFSGNRLMMLDFIFTPSERIEELNTGVVPVYFDPQSPSRSFLYIDYPSTSLSMIILCGTTIFFTGIIFPMLIVAVKNS